MEFTANWDLISIAVVVAGISIIGVSVYFSNKRSITNVSIFLFSIITIIWSVTNYFYYKTSVPSLSFLLIKFVIFLAVWHAYSFFQLCYVFPKTSIRFTKKYLFLLLPIVTLTAAITLTPLTFNKILSASSTGTVQKIQNGPGIVLFVLVVAFLICGGIFILIQKMLHSKGIERKQISIVTLGTFLTFVFIVVFNIIFPAILNKPQFIPYSAVFIIPFIAFTAYAILRHHLFDVKAIAVGSLLFLLSCASIAQIIIARSLFSLLFNISEFVLILIFGIFILRAVVLEINHLEKIEQLAKQLEKANLRLKALDKMKSEFVSIASHQLRSPLTSIRGYSSMLLEGSFGKIPQKALKAIERIDESSRFMATSVEDYLNVSRIQAGNMKYEYSDFNIRELAERTADDTRQLAIKKGLLLTFKSDMDKKGIVHADIGKTRQVIDNLINNALKYTPKGSITVFVHDAVKKKKVFVDICDTGIGMSEYTRENLFEKFERASNANAINVTGTGLGLFIARRMAREMGGDIFALSDGEGKGSTFRIEMPLLM